MDSKSDFLTEEAISELFERFSRPMVRPCLGPKHDGIVALGSMYVYKMKTMLTTAEVRRLREHYGDEQNFNSLHDWEP